jgi:hypothetical protein
MQSTLYLEIVSCLADDGFSFDELVVRTKELFEQDGMPGFVGLLLMLFDEQLSRHLLSGKVVPGISVCVCGHSHWELCVVEPRRLRTSIGVVRFQWRRLRCVACGKSIIPLRKAMRLNPYESKTGELEQIVAEIVSEQSYRRAANHLQTVALLDVPFMTAHRWVMQSACDTIATAGKQVDLLFADGTGYKRKAQKGESNRGQLRAVIGVDAAGQVVPLGAWTQESWDAIGQAIHAPPGEGEESDPIAKLLITDGELKIPDGLGHLAEEHGRCHWHQIHELNWVMSQSETAFPLKQRREFQKQLAGIIAIELPSEDFALVDADDKAEIVRRMSEAEQKLEELSAIFREKQCEEAALYIDNAKHQLFGYIRMWLKYGIVSPRANSLIERLMRELGRRLKKIGFGWSEAGAAKMARIIIKRVTSANDWKKFWDERLRIIGSVHLVFRGVKTVRPGPGIA